MLTSITPARMLRLCLKELRESLRDRRTITTLILMPLLVYPLLSLVLNRILLTTNPSSSPQAVRIGISDSISSQRLPQVLLEGFDLLQDWSAAPILFEPAKSDDASKTQLESLTEAQAKPKPILLDVPGSGRDELREQAVDLMIVSRGNLSNDQAAIADDGQSLSTADTAAEGQVESGWPTSAMGSYQVDYRQGDPRSERALQLLERIATAINVHAHDPPGSRPQVPLQLRVTPIAMKTSYLELLATMVPLVLVLMTMAGAVYPAIDLTAGERERGTMESLIVSPTPSWLILLAKYSAVVTVALLTALANLGAMTVTLWVSGIGKMVFGENTLTLGTLGTVLLLLVLFTMFFAALLLAVTSFAKSFKEAQAYLIPLMLLALTPGVMSLLPGIRFTTLLATVPLVNIVLLAREVLSGTAEWNTALVAVMCNTIYALAALVIASRLFGSDASMQGSKGSWRDLMSRPTEKQAFPSIDQMAITMAAMFPLYFIASSTLPNLPAALGFSESLSTNLWFSAGVSVLLILGTPLLAAWFRNLCFATTFRLHNPSGSSWLLLLPAMLLIAGSSWMFAHEIFMIGQQLFGTIQLEQFERVAEFQQRLKQVPWWIVVCALAITPAVCEEVLFRGFVLGSFSRLSTHWAIVLSAILFGLMHVLTSNVLAIERFLPTTFMGLILGWVAIRSGSLWPGMLLHALHNGLLLSMSHFQDQLKAWNILVVEDEHLPIIWLCCGALALLTGLGLVWMGGRAARELPES